MLTEDSAKRLQKLSKWAGWFYFLIILSSILSLVFLGGKYTVMGDSAASVTKMFDNTILVRINAVYEVLMFSAVIVLSVLLFELTKYQNATLARTAMLLRLAEALLGYLGIVLTLSVLSSASAETGSSGVGALPILLYNLKDLTYKILMVCISLGTVLFFYLFHSAKYIPRFLTIWGILGFSLMLFASLLQILDLRAGVYVNAIAAALAISFEFTVGLWLVFKGVKTES